MAWNQNFGEGANQGSTFAQQSWRDAFNGGNAAGDWTGNTNARLEAERAAFQGATWSGSSTQMSALEYARYLGSIGAGAGNTGLATGAGGAASSGSGAGAPSVSTQPGKPAGGGAGNRVVAIGGTSVYRPGFSPGLLDWQRPMQFDEAPEINGIKNQALKRIGIGGAQEAPGAISDIGWARTAAGEFMVIPSADVKERIEDDFFTQAQWSWRNVWGPSLGVVAQPRPDFLEPGGATFNFWTGGWSAGSNPRTRANGEIVKTGGGF